MKIIKRIAIVVIACIILGGLFAYYILSGRTFYADFVAQQVADAIYQLGGIKTTIRGVSGNPITGVNTGPILITSGDAVLMEAERAEMRVDLTSVLSTPKLARLSIYGSSADLDVMMKNIPPQQESSSPPALSRLTIHDSTLSTSHGELTVGDLRVDLGADAYDLDLKGAFRGKALSASLAISTRRGSMSLDKCSAKWGSLVLSANGDIMPDLHLICSLSGADAKIASEFLPQISEYKIAGIYDINAEITSNGDVAIKGDVAAGEGSAVGIDFSGLSTKYYFSGNNINISDATIKLYGGVVSCETSIALDDDVPSIDGSFNLEDVDLKLASGFLPWLEGIEGRVTASCRLAGRTDNLNGSGSIFSKKIVTRGVAATDVSANIKIPSISKINIDAKAKILGAPIAATGSVIVKPDVVAQFDIQGRKFKIEDLAGSAKAIKDNKIMGVCDFDAKIKTSGSSIEVTATAASPKISAMNKYDATDARAEVVYKDGLLAIPSFSMHVMGAQIVGSTYSPIKTTAKRPDITLSGTLKLDSIGSLAEVIPSIAEIGARGACEIAWKTGGDADSLAIEVAADSKKIVIMDKYVLNGVHTAGSYTKDRFAIKEASAMIFDSKVSAAGDLRMTKGGGVVYNIKGSVSKLDPQKLASLGLISDDISGLVTLDWRVWNENSDKPSLRLYFKDSTLRYSNIVEVANIKGNISYNGSDLNFDRFMTSMNNGYIELNGTVGGVSAGSINAKDMPLDLAVSFKSADIGRISRMFSPDAKAFQGMLSGAANITGKASDPRVKGSGVLSGVRAFGLFFPTIYINNVIGSLNGVEMPDVKAVFGRGEINSKISVALGDAPNIDITASGRSVDIRSLTFTLDRDTRRSLIGALDFDFSGKGWMKAFEGSGSFKIPSFTGMGIKLTDIRAPFWVNSGFVIIEESDANFYGGKIKAQLAKDLEKTNWGGKVDIYGMDVESFLKDIQPDLDGTITGKADLLLRVGGSSARTSLLDGGGILDISDGTVSGFKGAEAISKIAGGKPISFSKVHIPFMIDGETFNFLPGARASAPHGDPIFKYLTVDGSITLEDMRLNLSCLGNINLRALNSLIGGLHGVVNAAMSGTGDKNELLSTFLGGAITGFSKNQFRDVSMTIKGTSDDLRFDDLAIAQPMTYETMPDVLTQNNDNMKEKEKNFSVKVEFPVGPGSKEDSDVGGQVGGQVLEQTLKNLIRF